MVGDNEDLYNVPREKMNIIIIILEILLVVSVIVTAVQEPVVSVNYAKALITSSSKVVNWCIQKYNQGKKEVMMNQENSSDNKQEPTLPKG
jgi:hypothetical protein